MAVTSLAVERPASKISASWSRGESCEASSFAMTLLAIDWMFVREGDAWRLIRWEKAQRLSPGCAF